MKHHCINLTWTCVLACSYCWVGSTVRLQPELVRARIRSLSEWVHALHKDSPAIVDIAGGEPLLIPWLTDLIRACPQIRFGLSTNGLVSMGVERLCAAHLDNLISINVSYHPVGGRARIEKYTERWKNTVQSFIHAGYSVHSGIVNHGKNLEESEGILEWLSDNGSRGVFTAYGKPQGLDWIEQEGLHCQGGVNHLFIAPDGETWPCLTALACVRWRDLVLGNYIDGTIDIARRRQPCHLACTDQASDMWGLSVHGAVT